MTKNHKKVLWLITARAGSKSIPDKNIKPINGIPLMSYRILSALSIANKEDVWVSTDSERYAEIARQYGATVPFIRPAELATDTASSYAVVEHAMEFAEANGYEYDALGLLEPTSPLIFSYQLSDAINKLHEDKDAENVVAVRIVRPHTFFVQEHTQYLDVLADRLSQSSKHRRQDRKDEITPSGGFYISKWEAFKEHKTYYTRKTIPYLVST